MTNETKILDFELVTYGFVVSYIQTQHILFINNFFTIPAPTPLFQNLLDADLHFDVYNTKPAKPNTPHRNI